MPARLQTLVRRLRGRLGPRCVILLYHRIAEPAADVYRLCVSPKHFAEHMETIRKVGNPLRLEELADGVRERKLPNRGVCVTFDDGYQDNLYTAKPLMERADVPATVFMTTGRAGRDREFWWDELERILFEPQPLPPRLEMEIGGRSFRFNLDGTGGSADHENRNWSLLDPNPPSDRHATFQALYPILQTMPGSEQEGVLDRLVAWSGRDRIVRASHRALEPREVVDLASGGLLEIGGHTRSHPALSAQPVEVQREEVEQCKHDLEAWTGGPVRSFAYPYGLFDERTVSAVRRAGYARACACMGRPTRLDSDPYLLPRIDAPDVDGEALAAALNAYFKS